MVNDGGKKLLKFMGTFLMFLYPFIVFYALYSGISLKIISLLLIAIIGFNFLKFKSYIILFTGTLLSVLLFIYQNALFAKLYPVFMNLNISILFFISLFKKPLITAFAEKMGYKITPQVFIYTKKATIAWGIFMLVLTLFSIMTVFTSDYVWIIFNGFISYILIALMFLIEFIIRKRCSNV